jgi:hypothetical protein
MIGRLPRGRQGVVLAVALALIVAAAVLALVATLGGSDGPAAGSPDAVTDDFAGAFGSGHAGRLAAVACPGSQARLTQAAEHLPDGVSAATRLGSATVRGDVGVARVEVHLDGRSGTPSVVFVATVGLHRVTGAWCVQSVALAGPAG